MPFELTHLATGMAIRSRSWSPAYLAGLIYPDIRYSAGIDRRLTHEMGPLEGCGDKEFVEGVKIHLDTDRVWDEVVAEHQIPKPDESISDPVYTGGLKLIHDRVAYQYIPNPVDIGAMIEAYALPDNLPAAAKDWKKWTKAMAAYLTEGPTSRGFYEIVVKMGFQTPEEIRSRLVMIEEIYPKLEPTFSNIHQEVVSRLR
jgi:hypothetical protein